MDVPAGSHAQPSLERGGYVGDDVAKHIIGNDHVEGTWIADQLHAKCIHVHVLGFNFWVFGADRLEYSLPQASGVSHGIGFIAHENAGTWGTISFFVVGAIFEGISDDALDTFARVYVFLDRDLLGSSLLEDAARIDVSTFGIFTNDDEVHIFRFNTFQRTQ